ncbi:inactive serine/threonine-protein kinase TEX14 isoform X3 [Rhea pennata]|uniref:inactive serine/threonine-protein kinase TEX14 isoform X3 n=1 Tax=Rhea pennata TaxID=8795 RepID=UPI002E26393D
MHINFCPEKMAHAVPVPIPCPVQLGSIKNDSLEAQLHEYVRQGNYVKVKKLLKKGIFVDAVNSVGQTSLFTAALLGLGKIVDVLLDYGSDPNHRCYDGSTPVHAAAFSGNQWILSKLLDGGGDLRVHDKDGKNPQYWAMSAGKESSAQMLEFIQRCTSHMQAAIQNFPSDLLRKADSSKALIRSPSRFGGLVQGNVQSPLSRFLKGGVNSARNIYSFGFGKFYLTGSRHLGYLASLPIIGEKEVIQADDEPMFSYHVGPYMIMTNLMWGGSRVTVKELSFEPHQNCSKLRLADLLIAEQEYSSKLRHPHLLQLMSVCLSSDLEKTRLVYERVNFGSLYSILHERRSEFPVLRMETILHLLLQINDTLRFLHSRGFIHRSVTSYAIQIVSSGEAKLCNLEYMIESKDGGEHSDLTRIPVPVQLFKWCSPEVILEKAVTVKSDIYSFCTVMQEALTETLPWDGHEDSVIKQLISSGQHLEADVRLPKPYYDIVKSGLEPKQKNRSMNLQDIQYLMKNDLKDLTESQTGHADEIPKAQRSAVLADINICLASAFNYQKRTLGLEGEEITEIGKSTARRYSHFPEESEALLVDGETPSSLQPVAQEKSHDVASELQVTCSVSDVDESLCSFEMNEIFADYPEFHEDFLEESTVLGHNLKDEKRQQKEEEKTTLRDLFAPPGMHYEEKPVYEEGSFSELGTEYTTEEEERISEASQLCERSQVREDAGKRMTSSSQIGQHISKCVLNLKIAQSMLQQASGSLCRTEEKLNKLETTEKQKKLLQEIQMNQTCKQIFLERSWNGSDNIPQNTSSPFSRVNTFLWKAIGPPSSDYIPPLITCQAQGVLGEDYFQAIPKVSEGTWTIQNENGKCFHQRSKTENEDKLSFSTVKSLDDQMELDHEQLLPRGSQRCKKKFNLQCQKGSDSRSAASGIEEERWCCPKSTSETYSTKISEERRVMQSEWRTEVKQMARRVASGQLELISPYPPSEYTSESEAESIKEAFQHVTIRVQKSQDWQKDRRWKVDDNAEDLGSEERSESEDSDLESAFNSLGGRSCQSPSKDKQAESGTAHQKDSVVPQQVKNLSRGHSKELRCSPDSSPDVSEEFLTPDPDYFLPPTIQENSELETSNPEGKLEDTQEVYVQKQIPSDAGSGGKILLCSTAAQNSGSNTLGVNQLSHMPVARSLTDIQDLSSISCEQESYSKDINCKTPRGSHAPTSVSTPLGSEEKLPVATEKYRHSNEIVLDTSSWISEEISSAVSRTFSTAYEEEKSTEISSDSSGVCSSRLNKLSRLSVTSLRSPRKEPALSQTSNHFIDELPPPAQELLDEIEYLKQQDSTTQNLKEKALCDCDAPIKVSNQIKIEEGEAKKETERNEKRDHSLWTEETLNLAEETERAHSTLDDILERMLQTIPEDEENQEHPQVHSLTTKDPSLITLKDSTLCQTANLNDPGDGGKKNGVKECKTRGESRGPESCTSSPEDSHHEDQKLRLRRQLSWPSPFRVIVLDQRSSPK